MYVHINHSAERVFRTEKASLLETKEYVRHYHVKRNRRAFRNELITPNEDAGRIECRKRVVGFLKYFKYCHRRAV
ncbi:MAG: hypothetical protein GY826_25155 [Fuerstiella sp.]|nr:hypothetical protein [Fuerstiella sp.]